MKRALSSLVLALAAFAVACSSTPTESDDPVERLVEMHLKNAQTYYWAGPSHASSAYQQATKALDLEPDNVKGRFLQSMSLIQMGGEHPAIRGAAAVEIAEKQLIELKKDDDTYGWKIDLGIGWARSEIAKLYQRRVDRLEKQIRAKPETAARFQPDRDEARANRDEMFRSSNEICKSVLGRGEPGADENFISLLVLNVNYTYLGETEQALAYTERAVIVAEKSRAVWERWLEKPTTSQAQYEEAKAKLASSTEKENHARVACADHLFRLKRYPEALVHLDRVVQLDPRDEEARLQRAQINYELSNYAIARDDLKRYFALSSDNSSSPTAQTAAALLQKCNARLGSTEG